MNDEMQVSIIMVTWNSSSVIGPAIESLSLQTIKPNKVLIVDNGSADISALKTLLASFDFCTILELESNLGFAAANNIAIRMLADQDFIALLNPDAYPAIDWLEQLLLAADRCPNYSFFTSRQIQENSKFLDGAGDQLLFSGQPFRRGYGKKSVNRYLKDEPVFSACGAAALYRSVALLEADGFDEAYFCYVEDVDLGFRLQLLGHKCMYVANAAVTHIGSTSHGKRSNFSIYYGQRNVIRCFFKNMPLPLLIAFIIPHILSTLIYICWGIVTGRGFIVLKAKIDAVRNFRHTIEARKKVQSLKKVSALDICRALSYIKF